jgi:hypothetical protein
MDIGKEIADVATSVVTWLLTAVVGPIIIASWPRARLWFTARPWAIAGGVAFAISGLVTTAMLLLIKPYPVVPAGAVVAFNGPCPYGWELFGPAAARFVVGAGTPPAGSKWKRQRPGGGFDEVDLSPKKLMEDGGEEKHVLSVPELAKHAHDTYRTKGTAGQGDGKYPSWTVMSSPAEPIPVPTQEAGGNEAHNNLPPYVALNYCTKSSDR